MENRSRAGGQEPCGFGSASVDPTHVENQGDRPRSSRSLLTQVFSNRAATLLPFAVFVQPRKILRLEFSKIPEEFFRPIRRIDKNCFETLWSV